MSFLGSVFKSIAAPIVGGLFGSKSDKKAEAAAEAQRLQAQHQFDQQMDHKIRRQVADAKRAGIHPLYALGGSIGASPTISIAGGNIPGQSQLGSHMADAAHNIAGAMFPTPKDKTQAEQNQQLFEANLGRIKSETAANLMLAQQREAQIAAQKLNAMRTVTDYKEPSEIKTPLGNLELGPHTTQQEVEDQYGGIVGEAYGLSRFARDTYTQFDKKNRERGFYNSKKSYRSYDQVAP